MDGGRVRFTKIYLVLAAGILFASLIVIYSAFLPHPPTSTVVVYTSVDQIYSEPILKEFENRTGIHVLAVYDVEATKTTGLVNRLIAEKSRPQADVFWNGEFAQTLLLKQLGVLAPYSSPASADIPAQYKDPEGYWAGFGGRARVLLVNTNLLTPAEYPDSIFDFLDANFSGKDIGIAYPTFGTTATQAAALYAAIGSERARSFYAQLKSKGVRVVDGNSVVRDLVDSGQIKLGLTDTDDACGALSSGAPVALIFLDQGADGLGTLITPNTVAIIAGGPHPVEARTLIDYLLSRDIEEKLVASGWIQIPLRHFEGQRGCINHEIKGMNVSLSEIYQGMEPSNEDLGEIFIR
jgi:iron(III) transport system substrate-binding protein